MLRRYILVLIFLRHRLRSLYSLNCFLGEVLCIHGTDLLISKFPSF